MPLGLDGVFFAGDVPAAARSPMGQPATPSASKDIESHATTHRKRIRRLMTLTFSQNVANWPLPPL